MYKNESKRRAVVGVESAKTLEDLKDAVLDVFKTIDKEIKYKSDDIDDLRGEIIGIRK